jgi:hypothetical protein
MKKLIIAVSIIALSGCSVVQEIKQYWPKDHDPVMFGNLVTLDIGIENINCDQPTWKEINPTAEQLARYAEWRQDPQAVNLRGLQKHIEKMSQGGSKMFCELGKKTAHQRVEAAKSAWEGR